MVKGMSGGPKAAYEARIASGELRADAAQLGAVNAFEALHGALSADRTGRGFLGGLFKGKAEQGPKGLYLWGGVGRGKSMLMDIFFETAPLEKKRRVHFHAFMQEIHDALRTARAEGLKDPMKVVADRVADQVQLLCFDELQITDITDAMMVGRLFERLFEAGVVVVTTSNRVPDDLYKDGLNRKLFLPFIDLINARLDKRFVTLVDALYEAETRLICSAAAVPEALYEEGAGAFEFERTASRLIEMGSGSWP